MEVILIDLDLLGLLVLSSYDFDIFVDIFVEFYRFNKIIAIYPILQVQGGFSGEWQQPRRMQPKKKITIVYSSNHFIRCLSPPVPTWHCTLFILIPRLGVSPLAPCPLRSSWLMLCPDCQLRLPQALWWVTGSPACCCPGPSPYKPPPKLWPPTALTPCLSFLWGLPPVFPSTSLVVMVCVSPGAALTLPSPSWAGWWHLLQISPVVSLSLSSVPGSTTHTHQNIPLVSCSNSTASLPILDRMCGDEHAKEERLASTLEALISLNCPGQPHLAPGPNWKGASGGSAPVWVKSEAHCCLAQLLCLATVFLAWPWSCLIAMI